MKAKVGLYFYAPRMHSWGVWRYTLVTENGSSAEKVETFCFKEDAEKFVYKMNGWGEPKRHRGVA